MTSPGSSMMRSTLKGGYSLAECRYEKARCREVNPAPGLVDVYQLFCCEFCIAGEEDFEAFIVGCAQLGGSECLVDVAIQFLMSFQ